jgi:hypothetical protein
MPSTTSLRPIRSAETRQVKRRAGVLRNPLPNVRIQPKKSLRLSAFFAPLR